jgi:hypothetical protein
MRLAMPGSEPLEAAQRTLARRIPRLVVVYDPPVVQVPVHGVPVLEPWAIAANLVRHGVRSPSRCLQRVLADPKPLGEVRSSLDLLHLTGALIRLDCHARKSTTGRR